MLSRQLSRRTLPRARSVPDKFKYDGDVWILRTAKADFICAFSGRRIKKYDSYYRTTPRPSLDKLARMSVGYAYEAGIIE